MLRDQIADCDALEKKVGDAETTLDMVNGELAAATCYQQAVDSHAAEIDTIRKNAGGMLLEPLSLATQQVFDNYRATKSSGVAAPKQAWCDMLDATSQSFGGSIQQVEDASCQTAMQIRLAKMVVGETTIPGGTPDALAGGDATKDFLLTFVPKLVELMNNNTPGDTAAYTAQITETINAAVSATNELCGVLEDAGEMAGGTGAQTLRDGCVSKGLGMVAEELKTWTTPIGQ
jgi:hypothetical protein